MFWDLEDSSKMQFKLIPLNFVQFDILSSALPRGYQPGRCHPCSKPCLVAVHDKCCACSSDDAVDYVLVVQNLVLWITSLMSHRGATRHEVAMIVCIQH